MGCQQSALNGEYSEEGSAAVIRMSQTKKMSLCAVKFRTEEIWKNQEGVGTKIVHLSDEEKLMLKTSLSQKKLFTKLNNIELIQLISLGEMITFEANSFLFKKQHLPPALYIVKKGKLKCKKHKGKENEKTVSRGDLINMNGLIYEKKPPEPIKVIEDCQLYCLSQKVFKYYLKQRTEKHDQLAMSFIKKVESLNFLNIKEKSLLAHNTTIVKYYDGDVIFMEGCDINSIFVIMEGTVELASNGKTQLLKANDYMAGKIINKNESLSGTATCQSKSKVLYLSEEAIRTCLGNTLNEYVFISIIKEALLTLTFFKTMEEYTLNEIINCSILEKYGDGETVKPKGEVVDCFIVCIEGKINGSKEGSIFNLEYLVNSQQDKVYDKNLTKEEDGFVCFLEFESIQLITGASLDSIVNSKKNGKKKHKKNSSDDKESLMVSKQIKQLTLKQLIITKPLNIGGESHFYEVKADDGKKYTLRCVSKSYIIENDMEESVQKEKMVLETSKNLFVAKLQATMKDNHNIYFLQRKIQDQDFHGLLQTNTPISFQHCRFYFGCLMLALEELHSKNVIHRDLKPQNVTVLDNGYLSLFQLRKCKDLKQSTQFRTFTIIGTPEYMAPQILEGYGYTFSADIWSLGIILYEMSVGRKPYCSESNDPIECYEKICKNEIEIPADMDELTQDMIQRLLMKNPQERSVLNFSRLKQRDFLKQFAWNHFLAKKIPAPKLRARGKQAQRSINQPASQYFSKQNKGQPVPESKVSNWDSAF